MKSVVKHLMLLVAIVVIGCGSFTPIVNDDVLYDDVTHAFDDWNTTIGSVNEELELLGESSRVWDCITPTAPQHDKIMNMLSELQKHYLLYLDKGDTKDYIKVRQLLKDIEEEKLTFYPKVSRCLSAIRGEDEA